MCLEDFNYCGPKTPSTGNNGNAEVDDQVNVTLVGVQNAIPVNILSNNAIAASLLTILNINNKLDVSVENTENNAKNTVKDKNEVDAG
jgi:hypothetical protein